MEITRNLIIQSYFACSYTSPGSFISLWNFVGNFFPLEVTLCIKRCRQMDKWVDRQVEWNYIALVLEVGGITSQKNTLIKVANHSSSFSIQKNQHKIITVVCTVFTVIFHLIAVVCTVIFHLIAVSRPDDVNKLYSFTIRTLCIYFAF